MRNETQSVAREKALNKAHDISKETGMNVNATLLNAFEQMFYQGNEYAKTKLLKKDIPPTVNADVPPQEAYPGVKRTTTVAIPGSIRDLILDALTQKARTESAAPKLKKTLLRKANLQGTIMNLTLRLWALPCTCCFALVLVTPIGKFGRKFDSRKEAKAEFENTIKEQVAAGFKLS